MKVFIIFSICIAVVMSARRLRQEEKSILEDEEHKSVIRGRSAKFSENKKYFEFPWMVSLHYQGSFVCSSFLVTPKFLMTAAHCVVYKNKTAKDPKDFTAYMGTVHRDGPENKVTFTEVIPHENYVSYREYDIAIMKFSKPVILRYNIQTICLPTKDSVYENTVAQTMGWGVATIAGSRETSKTLQTSTEHVPENSVCDSTYTRVFGLYSIEPGDKPFVTRRHVCAGGDAYKGVCNGDSGGPLVAMSETKPVAIGIASFVTPLGCGRENVPAVFTATAMYTDWIVEHIGEDANDLCFVNKKK